MGNKISSLSWQRSELARYLRENEGNAFVDSKTVFLVNPKESSRLDHMIREDLWPVVLKGIEGTSIQVWNFADRFPASGTEAGWSSYTTRSLTFVFEDPDRPLAPGGGPPWNCRGHLSCSALDYNVSFDFHVDFPANFSNRKILELLSDPMFAGYPPTLSVDSGIQGKVLVVSFSEGSGAGWGIHSLEKSEACLLQKVKKNVVVIEAVNELERDYNNAKSFKALRTALRDAYQAY